MNKDDDSIDSEVDHSFFDSDYEEKQKVKENLAEGKPITDKSISEISLRNTETKNDKVSDLSDVSNSETNNLSDNCTEVQEAGEKRNGQLKEKLCNDDWQDLRSASASSAVSLDKSVGDVSEGSSTHINSKRKNSVLTLRVKKDGVEHYECDADSSEDEHDKERLRPKSAKFHNSHSRSSETKHVTYSSSCSSASCSSDTESDSYSSVSSYSSSRADDLDSSFSSPERKTKLSLPGAGKKNNRDYADESEDTVTDVTPLSTPDMSPIQSFDLSASSDTSKHKKIRRQENVSQEVYGDFKVEQEKSACNIEKGRSEISSARSGSTLLSDTVSLDSEHDRRSTQKVLDDAVDLNHLLKAFMHIEKKEQRNVIIDYPTPTPRKNYSFSNEEVRQIDRENQRLLKELSKQVSKSKTKSTIEKKPVVPSVRLYHTAINRQKEQQRIERENLALLKRLESVKPTTGMKRSEQLLDYQRQMGYLGSAQSLLKPNRSLGSKVPSGRSSRVPSANSCRSESASDASSAGLSRPNKPTKTRAAWM